MRVDESSWPITKNQLKAGRLLAGLGIRDLAEMSRISATAINMIETGRTESPRVQTLIALKNALQQSGIEFMGGGWVRHCDDLNNGNPNSNGTNLHLAKLERTLLTALRLIRDSRDLRDPHREPHQG